ncbi:MAG: ABC transporter ATP-binding protein/permease [Candidatus Cloacimonetes bacterium]|nr:ABC transporter ATP-binding protein/permease [Candidatus Cloacimonadota bacterium]MCF7814945.1 ABC transporter ATP-binding protein/permease [Candidatus Cloacimonadota bacterium]MCF7867323.1 ABC transporter ATP-binding protein/permease [Candidatus Cloacimonadota bacterium]
MDKLKRLWKFMKGNRSLYVISILAVGAAIFLRFAWPMVLRVTIDSIIGNKPVETSGWMQPVIIEILDFLGGKSVLEKSLWMSSLILLLLTISRGIFLFFKGKWAATASEAIARKIRDDVYDHLQYLPFEYHVKAKTGDLIQRCTSDVETVRRFLAMQLVEVGRALFMLFFALSFMLPMSVKMTLVSLSLVPFIFIFAVIFFMKVKVAFKASDESEGRLSTVLQENLSGVRVVRAFARQKYEIDKFDEKNVEYRDLTYKLIRLLAWYWSVSDFLSLTQIIAVTVLGTYWAAQGIITLGTLLAFTTYVGMLLWPVRQLGRVLTDMGKALVSIERIQEILDEPIEDLDNGISQEKLEGEIEFENVSFWYDEGHQILDDVSFKVEKGQTVAVLGPTGSGKSSLVNLLPRLYDNQKGSIKIDGIDVKNFSKRTLRNNIGIVLQEPFLFSKTLKDNIGIARREYEDDHVFKAAQIASVHDVIESFEDGYETAVGEKGVTLSGGQKQRVAIARTIINGSPILIFDDSLSAVDTETDAAIRKRLKKLDNKATTFIISHRLTTLAEADMILVLERGKIVQQGTHLELIDQEGLYKRVWGIQNTLEAELALEEKGLNAELDKNEKLKIS